MVFAKPVTQLTFEDIQALVNSDEPESITLEYKQAVDPSPRGKRELAKDVSAMANSQGGYLIIGIAEEDHRPVMPERFVPRMLGQQKVEEWLEQVLNSNIAQRVSVHIKPIPLADQADECVVVIHIPQSPRVPHMVTSEGQKRYYKRHNFQTLPAEEYEVRDMFERSQRMREEVERYLKKWGYPDPDEDPGFAFGMNRLTSKLGLVHMDQERTRVVEPAPTLISFVACPTILHEWIDTDNTDLHNWLDLANRNYYPGGPLIAPEASRRILAGLLYTVNIGLSDGDPPHPFLRYLALHRNGYVEYAYGDGLPVQEMRIINSFQLVGRFWQFLAFTRDFYDQVNLPSGVVLVLNMANIEQTCLAGTADGWSFSTDKPFERNLQHVTEVDFRTTEPNGVEAIVREFATRVGNAFGQESAHCFRKEDASFPSERFKPYD